MGIWEEFASVSPQKVGFEFWESDDLFNKFIGCNWHIYISYKSENSQIMQIRPNHLLQASSGYIALL